MCDVCILFRGVDYFNERGTFVDPHTIETTTKDGKKVSLSVCVHICVRFYRAVDVIVSVCDMCIYMGVDMYLCEGVCGVEQFQDLWVWSLHVRVCTESMMCPSLCRVMNSIESSWVLRSA